MPLCTPAWQIFVVNYSCSRITLKASEQCECHKRFSNSEQFKLYTQDRSLCILSGASSTRVMLVVATLSLSLALSPSFSLSLSIRPIHSDCCPVISLPFSPKIPINRVSDCRSIKQPTHWEAAKGSLFAFNCCWKRSICVSVCVRIHGGKTGNVLHLVKRYGPCVLDSMPSPQ